MPALNGNCWILFSPGPLQFLRGGMTIPSVLEVEERENMGNNPNVHPLPHPIISRAASRGKPPKQQCCPCTHLSPLAFWVSWLRAHHLANDSDF